MSKPKVTIEEYRQACNDMSGWCIQCDEWTNSCVEPDAEEYECEDCGRPSVVGAENAMIMRIFEIVFEDEEHTP